LLTTDSHIINLGMQRYVSLAQNLYGGTDNNTSSESLFILLQGSLDEALKPYQRLNRALISLFGFGLLFALTATLWLSRSISKPLEVLTENVGLIDAGDYSVRTDLQRDDELNTLGEQVRSLLGKVVSDEIATELLSKELELGGEEKEVTILFSDVRNFTAMCEGASPSTILERLNRYFDVVSKEIEQQGGVVDKYIGDAIMALYGAPVHYENAAERAIASALGMFKVLDDLNQTFESEGVATIGMGIGISTGKVVVGNMGSEKRLNYTAIGDDVNLAARLEGLTKAYGLPIIVSETTKRQAPHFHYRQVDKVRVKGKQEPVAICAPLGFLSEPLSQSQEAIAGYQLQGFMSYQNREWHAAINYFKQILNIDSTDTLAKIYIQRCQDFMQHPPDVNWDGVFTLESK